MNRSDRSFFRRRSIRLRNYDYRRSGMYFVTVCTYRHACIFGLVRDGQTVLTELGGLVQELWLQIPVRRANCELDAFVVMPNHLHGIIEICEIDSEQKRGKTSFNADVSRTTMRSGSLGATIGQFKSVVTKQSRALPLPPSSPIWQRNYYEHIIRNESGLNDIRKYILENPARWTDDDLFVD